MPSPDSAARERILATAHDLFYAEGLRAVGVDRLIAAAGVTKVTFYRHFPSKEALVMAFLELRHRLWMAWFIDALGRHGGAAPAGAPPAQGTLGALEALARSFDEWTAQPDFRGCAFINTLAEAASVGEAALDAVRSHKAETASVIAQLLPDELPARRARAEAVAVAFDGAVVHAQMATDPWGRRQAGAALRTLLRALDQPVTAPARPAARPR